MVRRLMFVAVLAIACGLTLAVSSAGAYPVFPILVMGDSYSAGNGAGSYQGPAGCWQSPKNYADLYAKALEQAPYDQPTSYRTSACSGDKTSSFFSTTSGRSPQLDAVNTSFGLILLTIGGDDVNFAGIVKNCLISAFIDPVTCKSLLTQAERLLDDGTIEGRVKHVLSEIHARANPQATIALLGYPYLESDPGYEINKGTPDAYNVGKWLRSIEDKGDTIQQRIVDQLNSKDATSAFVFVKTKALFKGHELSAESSNPKRWFVEPLTDSTIASHDTWYHPNPKGWAEEANLLLHDASIPKHWPAPPPVPSPPPPAAPPSTPPTPQPPTVEAQAGVVSFPGGPLTVSVGELGQCQSSYEESGDNYFPPDGNIGDCGFFLAFPAAGAGQPQALQGTTWGFEGQAGPHGLDSYTPVSQSPVTGSGTAGDPYTEVTVFKVEDYGGDEDARVSETTSYVDGATEFTSSYDVTNTSSGPLYFRAIYAGDLYVGGDDFGEGVYEAGSPRFVGGENIETGTVGGFVEVPQAPWSSFGEGCWNDTAYEDESEDEEGEEGGRCEGAAFSDYGIWHTVESTVEEPHAFNETIEPAEVDNAVGVEWDQLREAGLPAGAQQTFKIINEYRP
jgi:GDSL-like Lipase/Acylhydrolase family